MCVKLHCDMHGLSNHEEIEFSQPQFPCLRNGYQYPGVARSSLTVVAIQE